MTFKNHPLVGDPDYGGRLRIPSGASEQLATALRGFKRQALHASDLGFEHPVSGAQMNFHAPLPADLLGLLQVLADGVRTDFEAMQWP
jgi:23S rRNA pseudouridine1911/1915/1917 synthase